ncbi:hypothetical protein HNP72_000791 [Sphingobacterium soli]|nr:hypothetical protein [Sphingobacterium soli]
MIAGKAVIKKNSKLLIMAFFLNEKTLTMGARV